MREVMSDLAVAAIVLGALIFVFCFSCVVAPRRAQAWIGQFPRKKWTGRLLTAVDLIWAGWLLYNTSLGRFEGIKPFLWGLVPISFVLVVNLMDELLAPRALGGLFLLAPAQMLSVARWHASNWRLVMVVFAYLLVIAGMILALSPYQFRKVMTFCARTDARCRAWGTIGMGFGVMLFLLGITAF